MSMAYFWRLSLLVVLVLFPVVSVCGELSEESRLESGRALLVMKEKADLLRAEMKDMTLSSEKKVAQMSSVLEAAVKSVEAKEKQIKDLKASAEAAKKETVIAKKALETAMKGANSVTEHESLKKQLSDIQSSKNVQDNKAVTLLSEEIKTLKSKLAETIAGLKLKEEMAKKHNEAVAKLKAEVKSFSDKYSKEKEEWKQDAKSKNTSVDELKKKLASVLADNSVEKIQKLKLDVATHAKISEKLKEELSVQASEHKAAQEKLSKALQTASKSLTDVKSKLSKQKSTLNSEVQKSVHDAKLAVAKCAASQAAIKLKLSKTVASKEKIEESLAKIKAEFVTFVTKYNKERADFQDKKRQTSDLEKRVLSTQAALNQSVKAYNELLSKHSAVSAQLMSLKNKKVSDSAAIAKAFKKEEQGIKGEESVLKSLEDRLLAAKKTLESATSQHLANQKAQINAKEIEADIVELKSSISVQESTLKAVSSNLAQVARVFTALPDSVDQKKKLEELKSKVVDIQSSVDEDKKELQSLEKKRASVPATKSADVDAKLSVYKAALKALDDAKLKFNSRLSTHAKTKESLVIAGIVPTSTKPTASNIKAQSELKSSSTKPKAVDVKSKEASAKSKADFKESTKAKPVESKSSSSKHNSADIKRTEDSPKPKSSKAIVDAKASVKPKSSSNESKVNTKSSAVESKTSDVKSVNSNVDKGKPKPTLKPSAIRHTSGKHSDDAKVSAKVSVSESIADDETDENEEIEEPVKSKSNNVKETTVSKKPVENIVIPVYASKNTLALSKQYTDAVGQVEGLLFSQKQNDKLEQNLQEKLEKSVSTKKDKLVCSDLESLEENYESLVESLEEIMSKLNDRQSSLDANLAKLSKLSKSDVARAKELNVFIDTDKQMVSMYSVTHNSLNKQLKIALDDLEKTRACKSKEESLSSSVSVIKDNLKNAASVRDNLKVHLKKAESNVERIRGSLKLSIEADNKIANAQKNAESEAQVALKKKLAEVAAKAKSDQERFDSIRLAQLNLVKNQHSDMVKSQKAHLDKLTEISGVLVESQKAAAKAALSTVSDKLKQSDSRMESLEKRISELASVVSKAHANDESNDDLNEEISQLKKEHLKQLVSLKKAHEESLAAYKAKMEKKTQEIKTALKLRNENEMIPVWDKLARLTKELKAAKQAHHDAESKVSNLTKKIQVLEFELFGSKKSSK